MTNPSYDVNSQNSAPVQTWLSDKASARVFTDAYNSGREYDGSTAVEGKRQIGLLDPKNGQATLKPDLSPIEAGATKTSLEEILLGWNGTLELTLNDMNPLGKEVQVGTTASSISDTQPDTPVTGALASGSTKDLIQLDTGAAAAFSSSVGKPILVPTANSDAPALRAYIRSVDTTADTITPAFPLDEVPADTGNVALLTGFTQEIGGETMLQREFLISQDMGKGGRHVTVVWRAQPTGGLDIPLANGVQMQKISAKIQGHTRTVGSQAQQVPMTCFGTYGALTF